MYKLSLFKAINFTHVPYLILILSAVQQTKVSLALSVRKTVP